MTRVRSALRRGGFLISGGAGLSNPVIAVFALLGAITTAGYDSVAYPNSWNAWILTFTISAGLSTGFLVISQRAGARIGWSRVGASATIIVLATASLLRSIGVFVADEFLPGEPALLSTEVLRALASLTFTLALTLGTAVIVGLSRERGQLIARLEAEQMRLRETVASMELELLEEERELRSSTREMLETEMGEIRTLLQSTLDAREADVLADQIMVSVREFVRPVSHGVPRPKAIQLRDIPIVTARPLRPLHDRMDVPNSLRPGWMLCIIVVSLLPTTVLLDVSWTQMFLAVATGCAVCAILAMARTWWPARWRFMSVVAGMSVILGLSMAAYAAHRVFNPLIGNQSPPPVRLGGITFGLVLVCVVAITALLDQHAQAAAREISVVSMQLQEVAARIRRRLWLSHRAVSLSVHGPLQSMLVATAMRLRSASDSRPDLIHAQRRLDEALDAVSLPGTRSVSLLETLTELQELWSGLVSITYDISASAHAGLYAEPSLQECVSEICREAVANAIRHGSAKNIAVAVGTSQECIDVIVADDGTGITGAPRPGLGQVTLDEMCLRWEIANQPAGGPSCEPSSSSPSAGDSIGTLSPPDWALVFPPWNI